VQVQIMMGRKKKPITATKAIIIYGKKVGNKPNKPKWKQKIGGNNQEALLLCAIKMRHV